jgi:tetratricopeptide (TPR) repeat protein/pimeloyl-ACP methyl ester carboxylesterase
MVMLTRVHKVPEPKALNIIFVHGLGGHARSTWMHNPNDDSTLWPSWVGAEVECNIWIAGYNAALSGWTDPAMHLVDQGEALFAALQAETELQMSRIVLIGHSLGGLVIKSGMIQAQTLGDPRRETVLSCIAGVVFIGTPHQGSNLATVANNLRIVLRTNPQVINMVNDDAWLKMLNGQFQNLQLQRRFSVRVFFETKGVPLGWKLWGLSFGKRLTIVDRNSSDPGIAGVIPTGIDGDHIEIAKPKSRQDLSHKALVEFLVRVVEVQPINSFLESVTTIVERPLPKVDLGTFNIAIVKLENDNGELQRIVRASLNDNFNMFNTMEFDRNIPSIIGMRAGHLRAKELLNESGFDILIWGEKLERNGEDLLRLHLTSSREEAQEVSAGRYQTSSSYNLPLMFWQDLTHVLGLVIATSTTDFSERSGEYQADELKPFIKRVRDLLNNSLSEHWDVETRAQVQAALGGALRVFGEQTDSEESLIEALNVYRESLSIFTRLKNFENVAMVENSLGNALVALSTINTVGSTSRLQEAVDNYRKSAKYYLEKEPLDWAMTQNNLGAALVLLGERNRNFDLLNMAADAFRGALDKYDRSETPLAWAATRNNLGDALAAAGAHNQNSTFLQEAETAFREAFEVYKFNNKPLDLAMTQNNLGTVLMQLGERELSPKRLEDAVDIYNQLLFGKDIETSSLFKSRIQNNLGNALVALGKRQPTRITLEKAITLYRDALRIRTKDKNPRAFARTSTNLCIALTILGQRDSDIKMLEEAVAVCREAESKRNLKEEPLGWAMTQDALGCALRTVGYIQSNPHRIIEALDILRKAGYVRTQKECAFDWATTQQNIGVTLTALSELEPKTEHLTEAVNIYRLVQKEWTQKAMPINWALTERALGKALYMLGILETNPKLVNEAKVSVNAALVVFRKAGAIYYVKLAEEDLRAVTLNSIE